MSGRAIAGTRASTRCLLGLSHVLPQSSILYGPRRGDSSSAFAGDTRAAPAAPAAAPIMVRRAMVRFAVDMSSSPLFRTRFITTRRLRSLSQRMSAPRDEIAQSGDDCRLRMRSSVRLRSRVASKYPASIHVSAGGRSPLQRLCGGLVCRKETFESKLRERHVNWRAENRRRTYEAKLAGVGDDLEWDEHSRALVAARRHPRLQQIRGRKFRELLKQVDKRGISRSVDLATKSQQQMRPPLGEIGDARRESARMQAQPKYVDWRLEQFRVDLLKQRCHGCIGRHELPMAVDRECGKRLMSLQHTLDRTARRYHLRRGERSFLEYRSIAGCDQNHVAFTQRNVELFAEVQQHFPRGLRATGFEEAEMTG